jgi:hypothetical protein
MLRLKRSFTGSDMRPGSSRRFSSRNFALSVAVALVQRPRALSVFVFAVPKRSVPHHARSICVHVSHLHSSPFVSFRFITLSSLLKMSWAASAHLPSGRSRSRSPHRGSYSSRPPYPDHHGPDPYRSDWDSWDRERAYAMERDRAVYDYGRRGRSRSPEDGTSW